MSDVKVDATIPDRPARQEMKRGRDRECFNMLYDFLEFVDPDCAIKLESYDRTSEGAVRMRLSNETPISQWPVLHHTTRPFPITVRRHPDSQRQSLFCVESRVPNVSARKLFQLMHSCREKSKWDHTVLEQKIVEEGITAPIAGCDGVDFRVEYLASAGIMLVIKPTDSESGSRSLTFGRSRPIPQWSAFVLIPDFPQLSRILFALQIRPNRSITRTIPLDKDSLDSISVSAASSWSSSSTRMGSRVSSQPRYRI